MWIRRFGNFEVIGKAEDIAIALLLVGNSSAVHLHTTELVGPCKTEASQKPVPLDSRLAEALKVWHHHTRYSKVDDWVFASPAARGQRPYWGQCLM